jgi:hypothetical protein
MTVFSVGKATIARIEETYQAVYDPKELFPEFTTNCIASTRTGLRPITTIRRAAKSN